MNAVEVCCSVACRWLLRLLAIAVLLAAADSVQSAEKRKQPLLRINGQVDEAKGGFVVESVVAGGPAERLTPADGGAAVKLRAGDVITEVEGVTPADFRDFQDLLHYSFQQNKGKVKLTVRPAGSQAAKAYTAAPEESEVELAAREKKVEAPVGLGKPLLAAPAPPVVPPHVKP